MEDDGSYYYSPHESEGEVSHIYLFCLVGLNQYNVQYFNKVSFILPLA